MNRHFIYSMIGSEPAPASGGTTKSWFYWYKWDREGESYMPFPEGVLSEPYPSEGDYLWFVMDGKTIGCVPVQESRPSINCGVEVVYLMEEVLKVPEGCALQPPDTLDSGEANDADALRLDAWLTYLRATV